MKLSIIFPAYNEAQSITNVLEGFVQYCQIKNIDHEIIVVNDGSRDNTSMMVQNFIGTHSAVRLIEHGTNRGYGAALRSGFFAATGDFIFFTDSDGQFQPADLEATLPLLNPHNIILGYRQNRVEGFRRWLNAWLWNQCVKLTLGLHVRDLNCAWKVFPRVLLNDITLVSNGAFINAELLYCAKQKKLFFHEIPVQHYPRQGGLPTGANPKVIWRAFRELGYFWKNRTDLVTP